MNDTGECLSCICELSLAVAQLISVILQSLRRVQEDNAWIFFELRKSVPLCVLRNRFLCS